AGAALTCGPDELILQIAPFLNFAKAARYDLSEAQSPARRREQRRNLRSSNGDVGVINGLGRFSEILVSGQAVDLGCCGMDGIDRAFVPELANAADEHVRQCGAFG